MQTRGVICALLIVLLFLLTPTASAAEIGGEIKISLTGLIDEGSAVDTELAETADIEVFLPAFGKTEAKLAGTVSNTSAGPEFFLKKLYLKRRIGTTDLTVGRQPVSWSFGSLLNPLDYELGAVVFSEETDGRYQDAVELSIPFNWYSSVALVASYPKLADDVKWGVRARTVAAGWDLSTNYVWDPERAAAGSGSGQPLPSYRRYGITAKGDLGPAGVYCSVAAIDFATASEPVAVYLVGSDYSRQIGFTQSLSLQLEYLRAVGDGLPAIVMALGGQNPVGAEPVELMLGNLSYSLNEFSRLGLTTAFYPGDKSMMIVPSYSNELGGGLNLTVRASWLRGDEGSLFGPKRLDQTKALPVTGTVEIGFSYAF